MTPPLASDPRFLHLRRALDAPHRSDQPVPEATSEAAVSVVLRAAGELELLLIKRTVSERDPWSGHMALPGGRRDPLDANLLETAVRETWEETGVDLAGALPLGRLDDVRPQGPSLPRISISPFVFAVRPTVRAVANPAEVDAVHWVRLRALREPATRQDVEIHVRGGPRVFPAYAVADEVVWGLTYRILTTFLDRLPDGL